MNDNPPDPPSRQRRRALERERQKPQVKQRPSRLNREIKALIEREGDHCSVCRSHLMHNERTYFGYGDGVLMLTDNCCSSKLDHLVASGIYAAKHYDFILSSDSAPQLTIEEIELATMRMRMMIDLEDRQGSVH